MPKDTICRGQMLLNIKKRRLALPGHLKGRNSVQSRDGGNRFKNIL